MSCPEGAEIIAEKQTKAHLKSGTDSVTLVRRKRSKSGSVMCSTDSKAFFLSKDKVPCLYI